ncbi:MAG TPA: GNAT family N-acetyltransferase [Bacillota bacterium]|nr:GNAT family N-acetyltransferase [Bacillota bacterium]HPW41043.1 GNAT family N-acetyltransferase [Bacillota bacterium]
MIRPLNEWDRAIILDYLSRNEDEVAFVFGNILHCGITNRREVLRCGDYFGYFEGDSLRGILVFYNLGTCIPHYESIGAIPFFSKLMIMGRFNVLLGKEQIIRPLFEVIKNYKKLKEFEECSYQINRNFKPFKLEGAVFIDVSGNDDTSIINFVRKAYWRGFGAERTIEGTRLLLLQKNEEEEFIILSVDNKLVAQACIQTFTDNTNQIGAVYSLEEERGKGYAKAAVSELCERIIGRGKLPTLIVSKQNIPALNAYKALGFEHYSDYLIIKLFI